MQVLRTARRAPGEVHAGQPPQEGRHGLHPEPLGLRSSREPRTNASGRRLSRTARTPEEPSVGNAARSCPEAVGLARSVKVPAMRSASARRPAAARRS